MKKVKLGDVIDFFIAGDWGKEKSSAKTPNKVSCVRGADIDNINSNQSDAIPIRYVKNSSFENKTLEVGDIIIEKSGGSPIQSTGRVAIISEKIKNELNHIICSNFCSAFRVKPKYDALFVYYYFQHIYKSNIFFQFESQTTGIKNLLLDFALAEIPFKNFDPPTQTAIARVLSSLDDKVELNNKINKELENMAKTIYDYWFVQNADKKWERKKIVELIKNQKNGDWGKETKQGNYTEKVICIRGTDINSLTGNSELKAPERYILEKNSDKFLADGDFIIEISGGSPTQSTGRMAYILNDILKGFENPLICSNFCKVISLKDQNLFYYFIFAWKQLYENGLFFGYEGKTSGIKNFLFDDFVNFYKIVIPPTPILQKFNKIVSPLFSAIIKNQQENSCLAQQRDFLLPLLMGGEVGVG